MAHVSSYRAREGPARDREHRAAADGDSRTANFSDTVTDFNNVQSTLRSRKAAPEPEFVLATEPPTLEQRRLALIVVAVLFVVFAVTVAIGRTFAFALVPFRIDAFVPVLVALLFVNDFITATLLFGQFSIVRSPALLLIANAYLFTGVMAVLFALTFPGQFSPTGLLGAGLQSSAWIYNFWHYGFPVAVIGYAMLLGASPTKRPPHGSTPFAIALSVVILVSLVFGLTWLATAGERFLPPLFQDPIHPTPLARVVASSNTVICLVALALLYRFRRSVLDLWLMVVLCAWISELAILEVLLYPRFTFGFYVGRGFSLITSIVILVVLLQEMTQLHARLTRSNSALQRERNNKLMNLEAMAATIAHEVNQPLSALVTNGGICLRLLAKPDSDLDEMRDVLTRITEDGHRAGCIIASIRAMLRKDRREKSPVSIRDLVREVVASVNGELKTHRISLRAELDQELPRVVADRVQLQQVLLNLIMNALEAMTSVENGDRSLLIKSELRGPHHVLIRVEDSGPGIGPNDMERIFDAFFTTKSQGMGLGLSICQLIVEAHGGRLWASTRNPHGAVFCVELPSEQLVGQ